MICRLFEENETKVGEKFPLTPLNARIVRNILRLSKGDRVYLLNGRGGVTTAELLEIGKTRAAVAILERKEVSPPWPGITLLQGLPKGEKSSWIVQKGVELGVHQIVFFESARTIGKKSPGQPGRWRRVAIEALRQSGNVHLPDIVGPLPLSEALQKFSAQRSIFLDESERNQRFRDLFGSEIPPTVCLAVGPEGGWSDEDREQLRNQGFQPVRLGPFILRTETAAVAALAAVRAWLS